MSNTIDTYDALRSHVHAQLQKGEADGAKTFYQSALDAKTAIAQATEYSDKMGAVAAYGGVIKRWHHMLIVHITDIALKDATVSRANVRHWQKAMFGKSMDSKRLQRYADSSRGAGDKVAGLPTDDPASQEAAEMYAMFKDELKIAIKSKS